MSIVDQYQGYKDRLAGLLEKSRGLPGLLPKSASQIEIARRKLLESQFEIVLVGEFQGGKSTTFNCFCDGREISPRGKGGGGLKTSGCIVRAQNLSDPKKEEHAIVRWRTPEELLMGFDEILWRLIRSKQPNATTNNTEEPINLLDHFDPNTKNGRDAIKNAAKEEVAQWKANPALYDPDDIGLIDLVRFALIVAEYYDYPHFQALRQQEQFSISEVQRFITFPEDWQIRWDGWDATAFQPEELIFAFVSQVDCHLHSRNLERLGCAITDCPGLFASNWDTKVAHEALLRADAVLYLISGDRQLAQSDLKAAQTLQFGKGMIFVGSNCKTLTWNNADKIRHANLSLLQQQGLDIEARNIHLYHAGLALFSRHIDYGVHKLNEETLKALKADFNLSPEAGPDIIKGRLDKMIERFRGNLNPDDGSPSHPYQESRLPVLLDAVEQFIIQRKAKSILLNNGNRVRDALTETEGSLEHLENNAVKTLQQRKIECAQAETALDEFESNVKQYLAKIGNTAPARISETFIQHLHKSKPDLINELSDKLAREIKAIALPSWKTPKRIVDNLIKFTERQLNNWLSKQMGIWLNDLKNGHNEEFDITLNKPMQSFYEKLCLHWNRVESKKIPALTAIALPHAQNFKFKIQTELPSALIKEIRSVLDSVKTAHIMAAGMFILALLLTLLVIFTALTSPVLFFLVPLLILLFPSFKNDLWEGGKTPLKNKLGVTFKEIENKLKKEIKEALTVAIEHQKLFLTTEFIEHPRSIYMDRKQTAEAQFKLAQADRIAKAHQAQKDRKGHIVPLREACDKFLAEVAPYFAANGD